MQSGEKSLALLAISIIIVVIILVPLSEAGSTYREVICFEDEVLGYPVCFPNGDPSLVDVYCNTTVCIYPTHKETREVFDENGTFVWQCNPDPPCNDYCVSRTCKGDQLYCTMRQCTNNSPCNCTSSKIKEVEYFFYDGVPYRSSDFNLTGKMFYHIYQQSYEDILKDPSCTGSVLDRELVISCDNDTVVNVGKLDWQITTQTIGRVIRTTLPDSVLRVSGYFFIFSIDNVGPHLVSSFYYTAPPEQTVGSVSCPSSDCLFCPETLDNFSCQSATIRFTIVALMLLITVLFLMTCGWVIYALVFMCNGMKLMMKAMLYLGRGMYKVGRKGYTTVGESWSQAKEEVGEPSKGLDASCGRVNSKSMDEKTLDLESVEVHDPSKLTIQQATKMTATQRRNLAGLILLGAVPGANSWACTPGTTITSSTPTCVRSLNSVTCNYTNFEALISLPSTMTSACLTVNDDRGVPMGQINVNYDSLTQFNTLVSQYYTSPWTGFLQAYKNCWTPSNWCGGTCDRMSSTDNTGSGKIDDPNVRNWPGVTGCNRVCGCAGCNCFYCDDACLPWRWAIHGSSDYWEVLLPTTKEYRIKISVETPWSNISLPHARSLDVVSAGNFTFNVLGAFPSPLTSISPKGVLKHGNSYFLSDYCPLNSPCLNLPGDIQAAFPTNLTTASHHSFNFNRQIGTMNIGSSSATVSWAQNGILGNKFLLPYLYNSRVWEMNSGFLVANETQPSSMLVRMTTRSAFSFSRTLDLICPIAELVSVDGCYKCPLGAVAIFNIRSVCLPGLIPLRLVTEDNVTLSVNSLDIGTSNSSYSVTFDSFVKNVVFDIVFGTIDYNSTVHVTAVLRDYSEVTVPNGTDSATDGGSSSFWDGLSDLYKDKFFGNWWRSLLSSIAHIFMTIAIIIMIGFGATLLSNIKTKRGASKEGKSL